ncbi:MAG: alpha/beta fold hydrolase, partial [Chloroflexota bacterium]
GCLLVHGFTGTPKEMLWMGQDLNQRGYSVLGVRLAGHATVIEDMVRSRWEDWLYAVEDGWHLLNGISNQIFIIGLSMGGVLTLRFASEFPAAGIVAMSTPYALPDDPRMRYIKTISKFKPYLEKGKSDSLDQESLKGHISYHANPTRSIGELLDLLAEMRANLPKITAPALLMHSHNDQYVDPENLTKIYHDLGSADKTMLWLENSGHVIPREPEREIAYQATSDFIERIRESN